jgi:hypothetical protein
MQKSILIIAILVGLNLGCNRQDDSILRHAEVLGFNADKCMCCWGWTIKIENDTIKSDDAIIGETVGYEIDNPVSVFIEIGKIEHNCASYGYTISGNTRNYYEIKRIEKIK